MRDTKFCLSGNIVLLLKPELTGKCPPQKAVNSPGIPFIMHYAFIMYCAFNVVTCPREHYLARCLILQHLTVTVSSRVLKTILFRDPHDHSYFCTGMHISCGFSNEEWFSGRTTYSLISSFLYF